VRERGELVEEIGGERGRREEEEPQAMQRQNGDGRVMTKVVETTMDKKEE